eukprot:TRINITY_DN54049_c0_g1_i1.p1 TRINITY_DN54049_c0_g1~~TRINITY_DN54049_c0_g1_i1.p1  ORF type:complete len:268 (+),score=26.15 TRINITY_DN54049_c0_g1_i1:35-805(+)
MSVGIAVLPGDLSVVALNVLSKFTPKGATIQAIHCSPKPDLNLQTQVESQALSLGKEVNYTEVRPKENEGAEIADGVLKTSMKYGCELLCIATKHNGDRAGRVSDPIARQSCVPVLVVRGNTREFLAKSNKTILACMDGSELSKEGFTYLVKHLNPGDVVQPFILSGGDKDVPKDIGVQAPADITVKPLLVISRDVDLNVGQNICKVLNEVVDYDVLFISSTRKRKEDLGSVTSYCLYHSAVPVWVYKTGRLGSLQ